MLLGRLIILKIGLFGCESVFSLAVDMFVCKRFVCIEWLWIRVRFMVVGVVLSELELLSVS